MAANIDKRKNDFPAKTIQRSRKHLAAPRRIPLETFFHQISKGIAAGKCMGPHGLLLATDG